MAVGIMVRDEQVIAQLDALAAYEGRSRAATLKDALVTLAESVREADERDARFCRERVTYRTYSI